MSLVDFYQNSHLLRLKVDDYYPSRRQKIIQAMGHLLPQEVFYNTNMYQTALWRWLFALLSSRTVTLPAAILCTIFVRVVNILVWYDEELMFYCFSVRCFSAEMTKGSVYPWFTINFVTFHILVLALFSSLYLFFFLSSKFHNSSVQCIVHKSDWGTI